MKISKSHKIKILFFLLTTLICSYQISARARINLDQDGKADFLTYEVQTGNWWGYSTETQNISVIKWGLATDKPVPADYDGDGLTDIAVFRPSEGIWYIRRSIDGELFAVQWGLSTDILVPADYDGDGKTDIAVWRRTDGYWYVLSSSTLTPIISQTVVREGSGIPANQTTPVPADYDGDGKTDFAVKYLGSWFIVQSSSNTFIQRNANCGGFNFLIPSDFTGDGKADPACVYVRDDVQYVWKFTDFETTLQSNNFIWGAGVLLINQEDFVVPDDYDNDGKTDFAIYRNNGQWWIYPSSNQQHYVVHFGNGIPAQYFNLLED